MKWILAISAALCLVGCGAKVVPADPTPKPEPGTASTGAPQTPATTPNAGATARSGSGDTIAPIGSGAVPNGPITGGESVGGGGFGVGQAAKDQARRAASGASSSGATNSGE